MRALLPHDIVYNIKIRPDAEEVAASIISNRRLMYEASLLLETIHPGLIIDKAKIELLHVSQNSPLREAYLAVILLTFQDDIKRDVPKIIKDLTDVAMPDHYNTLISFLALTIAYYGIGAAIGIVRNGVNNLLTQKKYNQLVRIVADDLGVSEDVIHKSIEKTCQGKKRSAIMRSAVSFFRLPKRENGATVVVGGEMEIDHQTIREVPDLAQLDKTQPDEHTEDIQDIDVLFEAQDRGRLKIGWAGIIPSISDERIRMTIYPPLKAEELFLRPSVRGDIILVSKRQDDGSYKPHMFHLVRVRD